ncbi:pyridoxal-dependent decarboxylase [soil metagenome]
MTSNSREPLGDVAAAEMRAHLHRVADWVADYREGIAGRRIVPDVEPGDISAQLASSMPEEGEALDTILADFDTQVMPGIVHWGHPAFLGYFGSTSNGPALLGEVLAAALNVSAMTWKTSPAATELETLVLAWIRDLVGLPAEMFGIVYDTASVAVLHALAAARETACPGVRERGVAGRDDVPVMRVYASEQAHSSVDKAMVMLGLGEDNVVRIACDADYRMEVSALRRAMDQDVALGYRPMAVIATVGTTSSGSVDPVARIAEVCSEYGAWLHVDAAYGGAMGALPEARWVTSGCERANSIVVNPHKWLFVPLDFSTLYVRDPELLRVVFANTAEYLRGDASVSGGGTDVVNYMDYGIQLGRRFRALKAWIVLRAFGREGIAARIREHCRLARVFASWIDAAPSFELVAPVVMAVVCFRYLPADMDADAADAFNVRVVERVNASGEAYITHTRLAGRACMRIGVGNIATTEEHLAHVWSCVRREVATLVQHGFPLSRE